MVLLKIFKSVMKYPKSLKYVLFRFAETFGLLPMARAVEYDLLPYSQYAYGVYQAALQAKGLGVSAISVIEFGVAGGKGLVALEQHALRATKETGVSINVYGFDAESGLPQPADYRDLPYVWKKGSYTMDFTALSTALKDAELITGDVSETVPAFIQSVEHPPIGFVSFDMDYYSATKAALPILEGQAVTKLPRVLLYFDDLIGSDTALHSRYSGEMLAISEFNNQFEHMKIDLISLLKHKRVYPAAWNDLMFALHDFDHPSYNTYIGAANSQLPL